MNNSLIIFVPVLNKMNEDKVYKKKSINELHNLSINFDVNNALKYLKHNYTPEKHVICKVMVEKKSRKYKMFVTASNFNTKVCLVFKQFIGRACFCLN